MSEVRRLWESIPAVACQGLCAASCGPVPISGAEAAELASLGLSMGFDDATLDCWNLTVDGKCSIYENRPLLCRLWGAIPEMPCPFGCEQVLTSAAGKFFFNAMARVDHAAGHVGVEEWRL